MLSLPFAAAMPQPLPSPQTAVDAERAFAADAQMPGQRNGRQRQRVIDDQIAAPPPVPATP